MSHKSHLGEVGIPITLEVQDEVAVEVAVPTQEGAAVAPTSSEVLAQVLNLLSGLVVNVVACMTRAGRHSGVQHAATITPLMDDIFEAVMFSRPVTRPVMTRDEHNLF